VANRGFRNARLGTLGGQFSLANAINNSSQVVGYSSFGAATNSHGFISAAAGGMTDLGTLPTGMDSDATAINDVGMIVGNADNGKGNLRAVLWKKWKNSQSRPAQRFDLQRRQLH
jgi:probable HAF family extracellular repeat protein